MIRPIGRARLSVSLAWITVILSGLSLMAGKVWVPLSAWGSDDLQWWIVFELRLPRAILGVGVGAVLGLSGAVLQGYLRNPLADPGLIGVSRSEEHTSELPSLMHISYAVFCLKKKNTTAIFY